MDKNKSQYGNFYAPIMAASCHSLVMNVYALDLIFFTTAVAKFCTCMSSKCHIVVLMQQFPCFLKLNGSYI